MKPLISGLILTVLLGWLSGVMAEPIGHGNINWQQMMQVSGVNEVLDQANLLIDREIRNLEKAPLGFSSEDLRQMGHSFRARLGTEKLKRDIITRLQVELSARQTQQLQRVLGSNQLKQLNDLQVQLSDGEVRKAMRAYRLKVQEQSPNSKRMALVSSLDKLLQQSSMETQLKVELRKQLLATVFHLKTKQMFSEEMLDAQLQSYRKEVEGQISENALYAYLYLLKRTPTSKVRDLLASLDESAFRQFMEICLQSIQESFFQARQQLLKGMQLAGK